MENLPKKIYLQIEDDGAIGGDIDLSCVSWSADKIHDSDVEYVLNKEQKHIYTVVDSIGNLITCWRNEDDAKEHARALTEKHNSVFEVEIEPLF